MESRVLIFAMLAMSCSAQVRPTAVKDAEYVRHNKQLAGTATVMPDVPPVPSTPSGISSVTPENGYLSMLVNSLASMPRAIQPRDVTLPITISDVTGLNAALSQINNSIATLTTTTTNQGTTLTNLNTTVTNLNATVTNLSATVQSLVPVPTFVDFEKLTGSVNGSNSVFGVSATPSPPSSLVVFKNGMRLSSPGDYSLSGSTVLFSAGAVPQAGDVLTASYRR
jgi:uncharacterized coiled-coil protein SlyX